MGLSNAERQARWREKRDAEIAALRKAAGKAAPDAKPTLSPADAERLLKRVSELEAAHAAARVAKPAQAPAAFTDEARKKLESELRMLRNENAQQAAEIKKLKAKPPKVKLDPESEAARRVEYYKAEKAKLTQKVNSLTYRMRTLVPTEVKNAVVKALTEQTTSPQKRHDALQMWNARGLNNLGREW